MGSILDLDLGLAAHQRRPGHDGEDHRDAENRRAAGRGAERALRQRVGILDVVDAMLEAGIEVLGDPGSRCSSYELHAPLDDVAVAPAVVAGRDVGVGLREEGWLTDSVEVVGEVLEEFRTTHAAQ
jgi:hypothetical protein